MTPAARTAAGVSMVLITATDAAEILGVAPTTGYDSVQRGHLRHKLARTSGAPTTMLRRILSLARLRRG